MKKGELTNFESWAIAKSKPGTIFYSEKKDKDITAIASYHNKKIQTERVIAVTTAKIIPKSWYITKVTVL